MFDLEKSLARWRGRMFSAGIRQPSRLDELELHLREEIARLIQTGVAEPAAFETAVAQIGQAESLKHEFKKIDAESWHRPLAWTAWTLFVISFFIPALGTGYGWQCAGLSISTIFSSDFWHGNLDSIYLGSLTLANLLMLASPFLLVWSARHPQAVNALRAAAFSLLVLVWSYLGAFDWTLVHNGEEGLKIGCWLWGFSFLPLSLCTFRFRAPSPTSAQYV